MLNAKDYITIDNELLGGQPVFKSTRVPVESLFDHLEKGETLSHFLEDFPSVTKEQAVAVIEIASKLFSSSDILKIHETTT